MSTQRTALITGGTDGIGKATARKLLAEGWQVVIVGRNPTRCAATVAELKGANGAAGISALTADLSLLGQVRRVAGSFLDSHQSLDFLFLNANAIAQSRIITAEGFESNFALGYLGRALLALELQGILEATPGSQALTVVGLNVAHVDFDDLTMAKKYTSQEALGRWQWSMQVFSGEFNRRTPVAMNVYMPGLVRTKILANEPQPMRTMVKIMGRIVGIPVEKAADNIYSVLGDVSQNGSRDVTYAWSKLRRPQDLKMQPDDAARLWDVTEELLRPFRTPRPDGKRGAGSQPTKEAGARTAENMER